MGKDDQPKHRQHTRDLQRRAATRQVYERLLIICEGSKTEPQYLREICQEMRLATAHVQVRPCRDGTAPMQVVEFAEELFVNGDAARHMSPRAFDRIYVVFDRDEHHSYHQALAAAQAKHLFLENDEKERVPFVAIASVPCFEMWLLLHFEDVQAPMHRDAVYQRLRYHLPDYRKAKTGCWNRTRHLVDTATERARRRQQVTDAQNGQETYTDMGELVQVLRSLKQAG